MGDEQQSFANITYQPVKIAQPTSFISLLYSQAVVEDDPKYVVS